MKQLTYALLAVCCPIFAFTQDITGLWKGTMYNDSTQQTCSYEIVINKENGKFNAFSHTWYTINENKYYGVKKLKVRIAKDGKIVLQDVELIDNNYPSTPYKNVLQLNVLSLNSLGSETNMDGLFVTNSSKDFKGLTGIIKVTRVNQYANSDLLANLQKNKIDNELIVVKK